MFSWPSFMDFLPHSRVYVFADFIDPFCYIGFHSLRAAAAPLDIVPEWRGFELNPDTPLEGYWLQTAANSDLRPGMWASVKDYAGKAGLEFPEPQFVPNTRLAHELLEAISNPNVKNPLIERIYQAYFSENQDIGAVPVLLALAKDFGIAEEAARAAIKRPGTFLAKRRDEAKKRAFLGMPGFVYRRKSYFGALSQTAWRQIFTQKSTTKELVC